MPDRGSGFRVEYSPPVPDASTWITRPLYPSPGVQRMRFSVGQVRAMVDGAVRAGKIPPWRAGYYWHRIMAGGRTGAEVITTLLHLHPAPDLAASWAGDSRVVAASAGSPPGPDGDDEALYEALYPSDEQAAVWAERRTRQQAREAARFAQAQNYDNTLRAGGPPADPDGDLVYAAMFPESAPAHHGSVVGHGPATVVHEHEHSDYAGGTHYHEHRHDGDASHQPGANHMHQLAAAAQPMSLDEVYRAMGYE
jgi:hypothetical protein